MTKIPFFSPTLPTVSPSNGGQAVAVVTGATSGIGKATAICLSDAGFHVIGTSRNPQSIVNPVKGVEYVALDLEKPETIVTCAEEILRICAEKERGASASSTSGTNDTSSASSSATTSTSPSASASTSNTNDTSSANTSATTSTSPSATASASRGATGDGPIAAPVVLVNNAGESQSGPVEELPREALERLFQTNVIGQVELTQKLLPAMRAAGRGRIVMVGSMLGSFPLAYRSSYVASKAALKGFAFAARRELRPFGVGMSVVEPGSINTGLSQRRTKYVDLDGPYGKEFTTMLTRLDNNEANGISAEQVAQEIMKAVHDQAPRPLYATGSKAGLIFPLSRLLPLETTHWLINKVHGL